MKRHWLQRFRMYEFLVLFVLAGVFVYMRWSVNQKVCDGHLGTPGEILQCLDRNVEFVPMIDNQSHDTFAMRVHGFRGQNNWAVVFEQAVWWPSASGVHTIRYCHGSCAPESYGPKNRAGKLFDIAPVQDDGSAEFSKSGKWPESIVFRGITVPSAPQRTLKISDNPDADTYEFFLLFLDLAKNYEAAFFSSEAELAELVPGLPEIVSASRWYHPDVARDERPSDTVALTRLAEILASGEAGNGIPSDVENFDFEKWILRKNGIGKL